MSKTRIIRHSKIKNTGLLFEFLVRQITADVLNKTQKSSAIKIVKHRFHENTELGKELSLYNILMNTKFNTDKKANYLISEALMQRNSLDTSQLKREKYNLIKEIKEAFDLKNLFSTKIQNYKVYASIYSLFEYKNKISPERKTKAFFNIVEHVTTTNEFKSSSISRGKLSNDEDLRILSYKILLEKFNQKYSKLNNKQKSLLKAYINNISNTNLLKEYIQKEIVYVKSQLKKNKKNVDDKVTKIKLNEAINSIDKICGIGGKKVVKDSAVVQMMRYYELIKELKKHG